MPQVFIFGDSTLDIQGLQAILGENGYSADLLSKPWEELEDAPTEDVSLIFLDIPYLNRTGADVGSLIARCRRSTRARLIAMLASDRPQDFEIAGAVDDFITYPYSRYEVLARVQHVLGSGPQVHSSNTVRRGDLVIDQDRYEVWVGRAKIGLTYKEYELLKFLAANPGKVFPRDVLLDKVWGYNYFGGTRTVDVHIRRLRSKIEHSGHSFIETVRGVGYRFKPDS